MTVILLRASAIAPSSRCLLRPSARLRRGAPSKTTVYRRHATTSTSSSSNAAPSDVPVAPKSRRLRRTAVALGLLGSIAAAYQVYEASTSNTSQTLNERTFTPFTIVSKRPTSSTNTIFTLRPTNPSAEHNRIIGNAFQTSIWSVEFKQPQLQIARDYTPLPPSITSTNTQEKNDTDLSFLIRRDPGGEVSSWLHNLTEGSTLFLRGPHSNFQIKSPATQSPSQVLFIAGGTGIAPALQLAHALFEGNTAPSAATTAESNSEDISARRTLPKLHILWANRYREDCIGGISDSNSTSGSYLNAFLSRTSSIFTSTNDSTQHPIPQAQQNTIVQHLNALKEKYPNNITVDYFVDEESSFINTASITSSLTTLQSQTHSDKFKTSTSTAMTKLKAKMNGTSPTASEAVEGGNLIVVSGPEGFIKYFSGPKVWVNGREGQGRIGGVLGKMGLEGWRVWKL